MYQANRDPAEIKAYQQEYRAKNREALAEAATLRYRRNKDKLSAKARARRQADPEKYRLLNAHYYKTPSVKESNKKSKLKPTSKFYQYRYQAKLDGREFHLTQETFVELFNSACYYCAQETAAGLDRVDSARGYEVDNVLPCCKTCNYMKLTSSLSSFLRHCNIIASTTRIRRPSIRGDTRQVIASAATAYGMYRANAARKDRQFEITLAEFSRLYFSSYARIGSDLKCD